MTGLPFTIIGLAACILAGVAAGGIGLWKKGWVAGLAVGLGTLIVCGVVFYSALFLLLTISNM